MVQIKFCLTGEPQNDSLLVIAFLSVYMNWAVFMYCLNVIESSFKHARNDQCIINSLN